MLIHPLVAIWLAATPTLSQHISSSTNPEGLGIPGNAYQFALPNPVGAGNCLILGLSYAWSESRTVFVSDNNGNTWPASPAVTTSDRTNLISSIFILPNARPGATTITVTFDDLINPVQYTLSEFFNVDPVSPLNGQSSNNAAASPFLTTGRFTPGNNDPNGGNLIWNYYCTSGVGSSNWVTRFTSVDAFTLLDADIGFHAQGVQHASQYWVQPIAAELNPSMTANMTPADGDQFLALAVALKAASAGTPPPSGIRIVRVNHSTWNMPAPGNWDLQLPSIGNLLVLATNENSVIPVIGVTDSNGNNWVLVEPDGSEPQIWYAANAIPGPNLKVTLALDNGASNATVVLYDITSASTTPFDVAAGVPQTSVDDLSSIDHFPDITPTTVNGLTIACIGVGQGPELAINSPAGANDDLVHYAGELDTDLMDNADGKGHLYNSDLSPENWTWTITPISGNSAGALAVHFNGAPHDPEPREPP